MIRGHLRSRTLHATVCASVLVAVLLVGAICHGGEFAGFPRLFTTVRTGDTEVFTIDLETGDARNLTRSPTSEDRYPCWSPDGSKVAFTSDRDGTFNLYAMDADGGNVRRLTNEKPPAVAYMPSWSRDGRIVFGLDRAGKGLMGCVSPDGSNFRILGEGRDPCISPDGKTVAFTDRVRRGFCVFVMDMDGKNVRRLTTHENEIGAVLPTWSPDGKRILYADQVGDALEVFVCDADGKNIKQLSSLGKISASAAWSPDMKWISFRVTDVAYWRNEAAKEKAYSEKRPDKRPVWVMGADGSNPHVIELLHYQCAIDGSRASWKPK